MSQCHTGGVRNKILAMVLLTSALVQLSAGTNPASASTTAPRCDPASVHITEYNVNVATGHVDELFWIRNLSDERCTLRGYVWVVYVGTYGTKYSLAKEHVLIVKEEYAYGREIAEIGGLKKGLPLPTVTLLARGGVASFWIHGTDEQYQQANGRPSRCITSYKMLAWLPGAPTSVTVVPHRAAVFFWCGGIQVNPVLAGRSGSDPPKPLSYYFGTAG
jgi:hypothetical protein